MSNNFKAKLFSWGIVVFILLLIPSAFVTPSESQIQSIVTGLGLDAAPIGVSVSAQIVVPQPGGNYSQKMEIVTGEGKSVQEAMLNITLQIGHTLGLAHCYAIVIGDELANKNLSDVLDYFVRSDNLVNNTILVHTNGKASELLSASSQIDTNDTNSLQRITQFNNKYLQTQDTSLFGFYKNYLSPHKTSLMSSIDSTQDEPSEALGTSPVESGNSSGASTYAPESPPSGGSSNEAGSSGSQSDQSSGGGGQDAQSQSGSQGESGSQSQEQGADSSGSSGSGGDSGSSGGSSGSGGSGSSGGGSGSGQQTKIENKGKLAIFHEGKKVMVLDPEVARCFNWLDRNTGNNLITLEHVNDKQLKDATVILYQKEKKLRFSTGFVGNTPVIHAYIDLTLRTDEIIQGDDSVLPVYSNFIYEVLKDRIKTLVEGEVEEAMTISREYGFDLINFYNMFDCHNHNKWVDYLNTLIDPGDYMKNIEVYTHVTSKGQS